MDVLEGERLLVDPRCLARTGVLPARHVGELLQLGVGALQLLSLPEYFLLSLLALRDVNAQSGHAQGIAVAVVMAGGYALEIKDTVDIHLNTVRIAQRVQRIYPEPPSELAAVKRILDSRLLVEPWPFLKVGERVSIERGPLRGLEGIVIEFKGTCRLIASITLLQRSIAAEIDRESVRPLPSRICPIRLGMPLAAGVR